MRILIADDDDDDRVLASTAFREIDITLIVDFARDGQELMDKLCGDLKRKLRLPDLLLLDLNMPKKDGRTALKEIKSRADLRDLNVIIFSTSTSEEDKTFTLGLGARDYIVKPSDYNKLMEVFRHISTQLVD